MPHHVVAMIATLVGFIGSMTAVAIGIWVAISSQKKQAREEVSLKLPRQPTPRERIR